MEYLYGHMNLPEDLIEKWSSWVDHFAYQHLVKDYIQYYDDEKERWSRYTYLLDDGAYLHSFYHFDDGQEWNRGDIESEFRDIETVHREFEKSELYRVI